MAISLRVRNRFFAWLFVVPTLAVLTLLLAIPIVITIGLGFCSWNISLGQELRYEGIKHYVETLLDPAFWNAFRVTMIIVAATVSCEFALGLGIALLLNQERKGIRVFRTVFLLPFLMTPVIIGLQWRWLYNFQYGLINYILRNIGLPPQAWLANSSLVLPAIVLVDIWQWSSFVTLFILAGLQTIPKQLYEAAEIDGASKLSQLKNIVLPSLKSVILIVLIMKSLFSFRMFDKIYVLTEGGPAGASANLAMLMYREAFQFWHLGYAATLGGIMFIISTLIGVFYIRLIRIE